MKEIKDIKDNQLDIFCRMSEQEVAHIYEPGLGLFLAESEKVLRRAIEAGYEPECALVEKKVFPQIESILASFPDVRVYVAEYEVLKNITGYHLTGGVLCAMKRKPLPTVCDICRDKRRIVFLDGVVNPTNVGAIFRNAAALGMEGVILSADSCDPLYKRAIRVSMGNVFQIPWTRLDSSGADCIDDLKNQGFVTVATALDEKAKSIKDPQLKKAEKMVICMGSEGYGMKEDTLKKCDVTLYIPMFNGVDSLNVAAASALVFWELG